jgi:hypothetical protein
VTNAPYQNPNLPPFDASKINPMTGRDEYGRDEWGLRSPSYESIARHQPWLLGLDPRRDQWGESYAETLSTPAAPPAPVPAPAAPVIDLPSTPRLMDLLLTRTTLKMLPDPEPLIEGVLDCTTNVFLYGRWGTFKSFIAFDWAASVATGRAWQSRATKKRRVLYIAAEGGYGYKARMDAWEQGWHTLVADDDLHILPRAVNLTRPLEVAELRSLVEWNGYGFVVVDTLARCMVGADENSAKDCGMVVDALTKLREGTPDGRGCVTGVHHTGKDGKTFRGSSVFEAAADTVYSTTRDGGAVILEREKRKDGPLEDRHRLRFDTIDGTESGVLAAQGEMERNARSVSLLSTFVSHFADSGATKAELRNVADMGVGTFYRALNELLASGELVNTGTDKQPFYKAGSK